MKKVVLIAAILMCGFSGFSQSKAENSDKKLKFGFNVGLNYSNLIVDKDNFPTNTEISNGVGFQSIFPFRQEQKYHSTKVKLLPKKMME